MPQLSVYIKHLIASRLYFLRYRVIRERIEITSPIFTQTVENFYTSTELTGALDDKRHAYDVVQIFL